MVSIVVTMFLHEFLWPEPAGGAGAGYRKMQAMKVPRFRRQRLCTLLLTATVLSGAAAATAQDVHLMRLPGEAVEVMYSPGALDRAAHVQKRITALANTLRKWTEYPVGMTVYVLNREDWEASRAGPYYGVPGRVTGDALAIAAEGDMELAGLWQHLLGHPAPQLPGKPLIGPPEAADALAVSDLLLQLEATAAMLRQPGWAANTPLTTRLAVHLTAWDVLALLEPERLPVVNQVFTDLGRWPTKPLGSGELSIEEWLSLESHYFRGAEIIREEAAKTPSKKVLKAAAKNNGVIDLEPATKRNKQIRARLAEWSEEWAEAAGVASYSASADGNDAD